MEGVEVGKVEKGQKSRVRWREALRRVGAGSRERGRWADEVGRTVTGQGDRNKKTGGRVEARGTEDGGEWSGCGKKIGAENRARPGWAGQDGSGGQIAGGPGNRRTRWRDVHRGRGGI